MGAVEPPRTEDDIDIEALLESPEEQTTSDCTVGEDFRDEPEEELAAPPRPAQPLAAPCLRDFDADKRSGTRSLSVIRWIVIHCTQSNSARSSAMWFANPASKGSAHLLVDDRECYRTLANDVIPWGAKGANTMGFHVEHAGFAEWTRQKWLSHEQTIRRGAFKCVQHAVKFGIPIKLLSDDELKLGRRGFITHVQCSRVFGGQGHTDPGTNFPFDKFLQFAQDFAEEF